MPLPLLAGLPLLAKVLIGTAATGAAVGAVRAATDTEMDKPEDDRPAFDPDRSMFGETMDFLQLAAQPVQNMFAGRWGSAGRTLVDTAGRFADAFLPGDVIPDISKRSDITSPTEIAADALGADPEEVPWYVRLPVDIAGDIVTNPVGLLTFGSGSAAKGVATLGSQIDDIARIGTRAADTTSDVFRAGVSNSGIAPLVASKDALIAREIEAGLTRTARRALNKHGISTKEFAAEVMASAGNDVGKVVNLIDEGGEFAGMFKQGGLRFSGKRIPVPEIMNHAVTQVGKMSPSAEVALRRGGAALDSLGRSVGKGVKAITGRKSGIHPRLSQALDDAKRIGTNHAAVAARFTEDILSDLPADARQDLLDVFYNITQKDGTWETLSKGTVPNAPFMTRDDQIALLLGRIKEAKAAGKAFGGVADDVLYAKAKEIVDQQMTLFDIDTKLGFMNPPKMYVHPEQGMVHAQDILSTQKEALGRLNAGMKTQMDELGRYEAIRDGALEEFTGKITPEKAATLNKRIDELQTAIDDLTDTISATDDFAQFAADAGYALTPIDTASMSPPLYMHRMFTQGDEAAKFAAGGASNFTKARTLRDQDDFIAFLNNPDGGALNRSMADVLLQRVRKSGRDVSYASVMRNVVGNQREGKSLQGAFTKALEYLAEESPDLAKALVNASKPLPARSGVFKALNKVNRYWKGPVLFGLGLPRFMAPTRNRMWAAIQEAADEGARLSLNPVQAATDVGKSFALGGREYSKAFRKLIGRANDEAASASVEALGLTLPKDRISATLKLLDEAQGAAKGDFRRLGEAIEAVGKQADPSLRKWAKEAYDSGVLDGFVDTEEIVRRVSMNPKRQAMMDLFDVPAKIFQDVEHRMRISQFLDLRARGVSPGEAARVVNSAYLDYQVAGVADRAMRDVIPFGAFISRTIPQQFSALSRLGGYRSAVSSVYGQERSDVTVPPWVEDQAYIDLGMTDEQGNPIVAAGFGNPIEALNLLPSSATPQELGNTIRRSLVAQTNPLAKEVYTQVTGRDPFFGSKPGSYDKTPAFMRPLVPEERSEAGRKFQSLRRLGLTFPIESVVTQTDVLADEKLSVPARFVRLMSGVRIMPVDEARASVQQLRQAVEKNPRIRTGEFAFTTSTDPGTQELIEAFKAAKERARSRRQDR